MSRFFYGGIELAPCVVDVQRSYVWDGPIYLYTRHVIRVRGIYNPRTVSWDLQGKLVGTLDPSLGLNNRTSGVYPSPPSPTYPTSGAQLGLPKFADTPGTVPPADTDVAIRNILCRPRLPLFWENGGRAVLVSPLPLPGVVGQAPETFNRADANNGPIPLSHSIKEVWGQKSWVVELVVQTDLVEIDLFQSSSSVTALLSQRWAMSQTVDQDLFTTRTIRGHAIFRTDRLFALNATPDDYRNWLFHPTPPGFKRDRIEVVASEDGTRLDWVLTDREKAVTLIPQLNVTRVEAIFTQGFQRTGLEEFGASELRAGAGVVGLLIDIANPVNDLFNWHQVVQGGVSALTTEFDVPWRAAPRMSMNLVARVWGNRFATRAGLYLIAQAILLDRISKFSLNVGGTNAQVTEDGVGKFIELRASVTSGPLQTGVTLLNQLFGGGPALIPNFIIGPDEIQGVTTTFPQADPYPMNDTLANPGFNGQEGCRGAFVQAVAAQALNFDGPMAQPPSVPGVTLPPALNPNPGFTARQPGNNQS